MINHSDSAVNLQNCTTLQDAVNAVPNGGTIRIPLGIWEGNAVIPAEKYINIEGISPAMLGQAPPLGHGQWDWLLEYFPDTFINGSILRGHIDATANASKLSMSNVNLIGHGEGVAIDIGYPLAYGGLFHSVSIGNYEIGLRATGIYNLTIDRMQLAGLKTGLNITQSNLVRLRDVDAISCELAANLSGEISWQGGSAQACIDGIKMYQTSGYLGQIHFEEISNVALDFDGYGGKLDPCFYATNSGKVIIRGYNNILDIGWANDVEFVYPCSSFNFARVYGNISAANGWEDRIQTVKNIGVVNTRYVDSHKGAAYFEDGVVVPGDGKNYKISVVDGVLSAVEFE